MDQKRDTFEFDKFGHILFLNEDFAQSKFKLSCIVDACEPPTINGEKFKMHIFICEHILKAMW